MELTELKKQLKTTQETIQASKPNSTTNSKWDHLPQQSTAKATPPQQRAPQATTASPRSSNKPTLINSAVSEDQHSQRADLVPERTKQQNH